MTGAEKGGWRWHRYDDIVRMMARSGANNGYHSHSRCITSIITVVSIICTRSYHSSKNDAFVLITHVILNMT